MVFGNNTKMRKSPAFLFGWGSCRGPLRTYCILNTIIYLSNIYNGMSILYAISMYIIAGEYCGPGF